jgi:Na+/H+ antiporter NhaC
MNVTKGAALIIGCIMIMALAVIRAFVDMPIGAFLTAIVSLIGSYTGFQVVNNGVRGKFFNSELFRAENPKLHGHMEKTNRDNS